MNCWIYTYCWQPDRPLSNSERAKYRGGFNVHSEVDADYRPLRNRDNDYLRDRSVQLQRELHRHHRRQRAGRRHPGQPGTDPGSHQGASRPDRHRHRRVPQADDGHRPRACSRRRAQGRRRSRHRYAVRSGGWIAAPDKDLADGHDRALRPSTAATSATSTDWVTDAQQGRQRIPDAERPRHADGRAAAPLLDAGAALRGAARARRATEEDQASWARTCWPSATDRRTRRHRRAALPASRRQSLLRPQRGVRPALRLPRLEVRRRRQLRRPADLAAGVRPTRTRSSCWPIRCANGPTSSGSTWARASTMPELPQLELGLVPAGASLRLQEVAGLQLGAEPRGRDRHRALLVPARHPDQGRGHASSRSCARPRRSAQARRLHDRIRWVMDDPRPQVPDPEPRRRPGHRRRAQDRQRPTSTGASRSISMPNHALVPVAFPGEVYHGQCWVPVDDTNCWIYTYSWLPDRPLTNSEREKYADGPQPPRRGRRALRADAQHPQRLHDRPRAAEDAELHRHQRRVASRTPRSRTARAPIQDRTREHLGPTDVGIVEFRKLVMAAARALQQRRRAASCRRGASAMPCAPAAGSPRRRRISRRS